MVLTDSVSRQSDDIWKITTDTARIPILQNEQHHSITDAAPQRHPKEANAHLLWRPVPHSGTRKKDSLKWKEDKAHKDFGLCEQLPTCVRPQKTATKVPGVWMIRSRWQHNLHNELKAGMVWKGHDRTPRRARHKHWNLKFSRWR